MKAVFASESLPAYQPAALCAPSPSAPACSAAVEMLNALPPRISPSKPVSRAILIVVAATSPEEVVTKMTSAFSLIAASIAGCGPASSGAKCSSDATSMPFSSNASSAIAARRLAEGVVEREDHDRASSRSRSAA